MIGIELVKEPDKAARLVNQERPKRLENEVLLRTCCVGLCRTDLLVASGSIPVPFKLALGHEFSARVEEGTSKFSAGELVAVDPTFERDDGSDGFIGRDKQGALASWVVMPEDKIFKAQGLTPRQAAYLEPVAAALGGVEEALRLGDNGAILGSNRIALLTQECYQSLTGKTVPIIGWQEFQENKRDKFSNRFDWLLETRLKDDALDIACKALKTRGTLILKSRHAENIRLPARKWAERQLNIAARSRCSFSTALDWLVEHRLKVEPLLGKSFALKEWEKAFEWANTVEQGKTFIIVSEE